MSLVNKAIYSFKINISFLGITVETLLFKKMAIWKEYRKKQICQTSFICIFYEYLIYVLYLLQSWYLLNYGGTDFKGGFNSGVTKLLLEENIAILKSIQIEKRKSLFFIYQYFN